MHQTLDELKAENVATEAAAQEPEAAAPQADDEDLGGIEEVEAGTEETVVEESRAAAEEEGETAGAELEAWQESDESDDGKKFTDSDIGSIKRKLKAKITRQVQKERSTEVEDLRAQLQELQKSSAPRRNTRQAEPVRPKYDDYDDEDGYNVAMDNYQDKRTEVMFAKRDASQLDDSRQRDAVSVRTNAVNDHIDRAAELVQKAGISPDAFKDGEVRVRNALDAISPGNGDEYADIFIGALGVGSEKVIYNLSRNASKLRALTDKLASDPTGLSATIYLGELKSALTSAGKIRNKAPKPATQIGGTASGGATVAKLERAYKKISNSSTASAQESFDARMALNRARKAQTK